MGRGRRSLAGSADKGSPRATIAARWHSTRGSTNSPPAWPASTRRGSSMSASSSACWPRSATRARTARPPPISPRPPSVPLDQHLPESLGGQFVHAAIASLDYDGLLDVVRTGRPVVDRPDRFRASIERLTVQDIAVFFQEALTALPELTADLARGIRAVDVHCGGGRWLIAMARRFPESEFLGVESEHDSAGRARANVADAGLADRIE